MEKESQFTLMMLFKLIKKHLTFFIITILSCLILVTIWSFIMPQEYEATATVLPPQRSDASGNLSSFLQSFSGSGGIVLGNMGQTNQTQVFGEILKSRSLIDFLIDKYKLREHKFFRNLRRNDIHYILKNSSEIEIERSGLIIVTYLAATPYFASSADVDSASKLSETLANGAVEGLNYLVREKNISTAKKTRMYIEGEIVRYKTQLDSVELNLEKFQSENKVLAIDEQTKALLNQAIEIGSELNKAEIDLNLAQYELAPSSQKVKSLEKSVDFLRSQYQKIQMGGLTSTDRFSIPLENLPELIRIYTVLVREQKILEQVILYLETQRHQEAIQEERDLPVVEMLDKAVVPEQRSAPSRKLMLVLTLFISSFLTVGFILLRAYFKSESI